MYPVVLLAGCMAHLTGGAVLAVHGAIGLFVWMRGRPEGRAIVRGATIGGVLTVLWLLPGIPSMTVALEKTNAGVEGSEWTTLGWMIRTTLEGLSSGIPGGLPALLLGALVGGVGLLSVVRRSPEAAVAMVLPPVLILAGLVATNHNLWPRFFFFAMAFIVLFGVRGLTESLRAIVGRRGVPAAFGILLLAAVGSALTVPSIWGPKQDYEGVAAWLDEAGLEAGQIAYLSFAYRGFIQYLGVPGNRVETLDELLALEQDTDRMVVVYTLPENLRTAHPDLWAHVQDRYDEARVFGGVITGAELVVMESDTRGASPVGD